MRWLSWLRRNKNERANVAASTEARDYLPTVMIGGRARTLGVPYMLPADMDELNRLDFQHYMLKFALQGLYAAPLQAPTSILDVGTGSGRWAMDMAQLFPNAKSIGVDVNPPPADQRAEHGVGTDIRPSNYEFMPGNVLEGLPFPDASFDFVHMRYLLAAIPHDRWPFAVRELVRVTRPGGWVESVETNVLQRGGPVLEQLMQWALQAAMRRGIDMTDASKVVDLLRANNLANVTTGYSELPCGPYGGRLGKMVETDYMNVTRAFGGMMVAQGITTQDEFNQLYALATDELHAPGNRCYAPVYIALGQRP